VVTNDHPFATDLSRFDGRNSLTCFGAGALCALGASFIYQ
jgi:hypothetical protein